MDKNEPVSSVEQAQERMEEEDTTAKKEDYEVPPAPKKREMEPSESPADTAASQRPPPDTSAETTKPPAQEDQAAAAPSPAPVVTLSRDAFLNKEVGFTAPQGQSLDHGVQASNGPVWKLAGAIRSALGIAAGGELRLAVMKGDLHMPSLAEQNKLEGEVGRKLTKITSVEDWLRKYTGNPEGGQLNSARALQDDFFIMFAAQFNNDEACNFIHVNPPAQKLLLDCYSVESFLKSVENLRAIKDPHFRIKEVLQRGIPLACHAETLTLQGSSLEFLDRQRAFSRALKEFGSRLINRGPTSDSTSPVPLVGDMTDHRNWMRKMVACGAPGSGKSRLLVELASLNNYTIQKPAEIDGLIDEALIKMQQRVPAGINTVERNDLRDRIAGWVPVVVTFNGTTLATDQDKASPELGVAQRMLYSHLCVTDKIKFEEFRQHVLGLSANPMHFAVDVILKDTNAKSIFIGIDEIMNLRRPTNDDDPVKILLHQLTVLSLDFRGSKGGVVFDVVTSLNQGVMQKDADESGVRLRRLPLSPLSMVARQHLFHLFDLPSKEAKHHLCVALADTGGRPGLVYALYSLLKGNALTAGFLRLCPYDLPAVKSFCRNPNWLDITFTDIKELVCCSKQILRDKNKMIDEEVQQKIASGEVFEDAKGYITVAPMAVAHWADRVLEGKITTTTTTTTTTATTTTTPITTHDVIAGSFINTKDTATQIEAKLRWFENVQLHVESKVAMLLKTMLAPTPWTGVGRITTAVTDTSVDERRDEAEWNIVRHGNGFEEFCVLLLPLWSYGFERDEPRVCTIREMLSPPPPSQGDLATLMCSRGSVDGIWNRRVIFPAKQKIVTFSGTFRIFMAMLKKAEKEDQLGVGTMVYCLGSNPGFESAIKLKWEESGKSFWLLIEARFSASGSSTKFGTEDVEGKLKALKTHVFFDVKYGGKDTPSTLANRLTIEDLKERLEEVGVEVSSKAKKTALVDKFVANKALVQEVEKEANAEFVHVFFLCRDIASGPKLTTLLGSLQDNIIIVPKETLINRVGPTLASHFASDFQFNQTTTTTTAAPDQQ